MRQTAIEYLTERMGEKYVHTRVLDGSGISYLFGDVVAHNLFDLDLQKGKEMKQPKKLTLEQKKAVSAHYLNANDWMLVEETDFYLKIIHKETRQRKTIDKFRREVKRR